MDGENIKHSTPVPASRPPFNTPIAYLGWRDLISVLQAFEGELRDLEQALQNQATMLAEQARLVNKNPLRMKEAEALRQQAAKTAQRCVRCGDLAYEAARMVRVVNGWSEIGPSPAVSNEKVLINERWQEMRGEVSRLLE